MNLCRGSEAHDIKSLVKEEMVDPTSKQIVSEHLIICAKCGMTLEEIRGPKKVVRRNKPKQAPEVDPSKLD